MRRLSPGSGTVRYIGSGRTNPYAVHPPTVGGVRPKAICSVPDRQTGYAVLRLWHAGKYKPGTEEILAASLHSSDSASFGDVKTVDNDDLLQMLKDGVNGEASRATVAEVYQKYLAYRLSPAFTKGTDVNALNSAYTKLSDFHDLPLDSVTVDDWQEVVNEVAEDYSKTTVIRTVGLIKKLYNYALIRELCTKDSGLHVEMPAVKGETHHQDFTDAELEVLWRHSNDEVVKMVLVMVYSGFRIGAFAPEAGMETHLEAAVPYFRGGVKTKAGKNRIVPIHSAILEMVREMRGVYLCGKSAGQFRKDMKRKMVELGIDTPTSTVSASPDAPVSSAQDEHRGVDAASVDNSGDAHRGAAAETEQNAVKLDKNADAAVATPETVARHHTPHSTRHTFSRLCESYGVREPDRKRLLGHSFGNDVTNGVYGHRSVAELQLEVEKIKKPVF